MSQLPNPYASHHRDGVTGDVVPPSSGDLFDYEEPWNEVGKKAVTLQREESLKQEGKKATLQREEALKQEGKKAKREVTLKQEGKKATVQREESLKQESIAAIQQPSLQPDRAAVEQNNSSSQEELLSQAANQAMISARSIMLAGGTQSAALSAARAAAFFVLGSREDDDTSQTANFSKHSQKKAKRQSNIIAEMALLSVKNGLAQGGEVTYPIAPEQRDESSSPVDDPPMIIRQVSSMSQSQSSVRYAGHLPGTRQVHALDCGSQSTDNWLDEVENADIGRKTTTSRAVQRRHLVTASDHCIRGNVISGERSHSQIITSSSSTDSFPEASSPTSLRKGEKSRDRHGPTPSAPHGITTKRSGATTGVVRGRRPHRKFRIDVKDQAREADDQEEKNTGDVVAQASSDEYNSSRTSSVTEDELSYDSISIVFSEHEDAYAVVQDVIDPLLSAFSMAFNCSAVPEGSRQRVSPPPSGKVPSTQKTSEGEGQLSLSPSEEKYCEAVATVKPSGNEQEMHEKRTLQKHIREHMEEVLQGAISGSDTNGSKGSIGTLSLSMKEGGDAQADPAAAGVVKPTHELLDPANRQETRESLNVQGKEHNVDALSKQKECTKTDPQEEASRSRPGTGANKSTIETSTRKKQNGKAISPSNNKAKAETQKPGKSGKNGKKAPRFRRWITGKRRGVKKDK